MQQEQELARRGFVVALLGAECTGKTTLARQMAAALRAQHTPAIVVPEALRSFSARMGRTPRCDEQPGIAEAQTSAIARAAARHPIVIADTTALMTAVYSEQVFGDTGLYARGLRDHRRAGLTLLAASDLPWQADGHQRDGPAARQAVERLLRRALDRAGMPYAVITGSGAQRLHAAMAALRRAMSVPATAAAPRWRYRCLRCDAIDCAAPPHAEPGSHGPAPAHPVGQLLHGGPGAPDTDDAQ